MRDWYVADGFIEGDIWPLEVLSATRLPTSSGWKLHEFVKFETTHFQILIFKHSFHSQQQWFDRLIKQIKYYLCD